MNSFYSLFVSPDALARAYDTHHPSDYHPIRLEVTSLCASGCETDVTLFFTDREALRVFWDKLDASVKRLLAQEARR